MGTKHFLADLDDAELLSGILSPATVKEMVAEYGNVRSVLANAYPDELAKMKGIGPVKARQLQYLCELAKRFYQETAPAMQTIRTPQDVFTRMTEIRFLTQEEMRVIFLTTKNGVIAERMITRGTLNASLVSPREIFHRAIKLMAASVILVHNHPSGDPTPSPEDIALTRKVVEAGAILDIAVLDHIIVANSGYASLKEKGLL